MRRLPAALQLAGLAIFALGLGLVWLPLGIVAAGAGVFAVGFVADQRGTP